MNTMRWSKALLLSLLALMLARCSPQSHEAYLPGERRDKGISDQDGTAYLDPLVDILFVIDDSGSMDNHQTNLINNITQFTSAFVANAILNYQIGVVTTDMDAYNRSGRLLGNPKIVTRSTPNASRVLAYNLRAGTGGSGYEHPLTAVFDALRPPLSYGYNSGFLRDDATLVTIFLTDTNGRDEITPDELYQNLVSLKKGNAKKVLAFGAIIPTGYPESRDCVRDTEGAPVAIERFLSLVANAGNNVLNLCESDFGSRLAEFANDIVDRVGTTIYLTRRPNLESIRVVYGAIDLPKDTHKGWSFDAELNAIKLGDQIDWSTQPQGSKVVVYYTEARGN